MILGSTLAVEAGIKDPTPFMFFPLVVHAMDIVVSSLGILYVGSGDHTQNRDPMAVLKGGYYVTAVRVSLPFSVYIVRTSGALSIQSLLPLPLLPLPLLNPTVPPTPPLRWPRAWAFWRPPGCCSTLPRPPGHGCTSQAVGR